MERRLPFGYQIFLTVCDLGRRDALRARKRKKPDSCKAIRLSLEFFGGADGARTRYPRRDRLFKTDSLKLTKHKILLKISVLGEMMLL